MMLKSARYRSKKYGIPIDIHLEDIPESDTCPILRIKFEHKLFDGYKNLQNSRTLDRIDPSKGYVKGNIQVISYKANTMKNNATPEELKAFASWVLVNY